jgi:predicted DNA-binding transcriptional regulator YafY
VNRTDRLYAIVEELRRATPGHRTAAQLAERFEVTTRTIKRDVSSLQQSGVPIWATAGPGGGYGLEADASLPPLTFTPGEATAIALALAANPDQPYAVDGASALTKVLGAMTPAARDSAAALGARVWIRDEGPVRTAPARVLDEALRTGVVAVIDYRDGEGRTTQKRPVEPLTFARTRGHWYLMAWCRTRRAGRWFRLDRITGARLTTQRFDPRDLADVFGPPPDDASPISFG